MVYSIERKLRISFPLLNLLWRWTWIVVCDCAWGIFPCKTFRNYWGEKASCVSLGCGKHGRSAGPRPCWLGPLHRVYSWQCACKWVVILISDDWRSGKEDFLLIFSPFIVSRFGENTFIIGRRRGLSIFWNRVIARQLVHLSSDLPSEPWKKK